MSLPLSGEPVNDTTEVLLKIGTGAAAGAGLLASTSSGAWAEWIERLGFPIACVCGIAWAVVRLARWFGAKVVEPIATRHVTLMDTLEHTAKAQAEALNQKAVAMERIAVSEAATLDCVKRLEESASADRKSAAEDRLMARLAIEGVNQAVERLARAIEGTPVQPFRQQPPSPG